MFFFLPFAEAAFKHDEFDKYLKRYVKSGHVDYESMSKDDYPLKHYLKLVGKYPLTELNAESRNNIMAFYINAYNAITIKRVLDNYPPFYTSTFFRVKQGYKSIKNIKGVWSVLKSRVAGSMMTLDNIEHKILRKKFRDPRIHFALVCASKGCPKLQSYAFKGSELGRQLDECAAVFLKTASKNNLCIKCDTLGLSKIFEWYGNDFTRKYGNNLVLNKKYGKKIGSVLNFATKYLDRKFTKSIHDKKYKIKFLDYSWELNE